MPRPRSQRRVATALFLDVVGSTALATRLGDAAWKAVLVRFRRTVRAEIKRAQGHEQDTTGDGFLVTFAEPAQALRAAVGIVVGVQHLGLDVRIGIHSGEVEPIDGGQVGGIAVHLAARVMAVAGPAEVLATSTVRELVSGSGARFIEQGTHALKGVDETRTLYQLLAFEEAIPPPLDDATATDRIAAIAHAGSAKARWRSTRVALIATAVALAAVGVFAITALDSSNGLHLDALSVMRIDPRTGRVIARVPDTIGIPNRYTVIFSRDGTLWEWATYYGTARRNMETGAVAAKLPLPCCVSGFDIAFGSLWLFKNHRANSAENPWIERVDELSLREIGRIPIRGRFIGSGGGEGSYWFISSDGKLLQINPSTDRIDATYSTPAPRVSTPVVVLHHVVWFCLCDQHRLIGLRLATRKTTDVETPEIAGSLLNTPSSVQQLWLFDPKGATLTPVNPSTGLVGQPIGLAGRPYEAAVGADAIWVAAGQYVDRVDLHSGARITFPAPRGAWISSIAVDSATNAVWILNDVAARAHPEWAGP
jgi:class 3 adenylate cyclase/streptogramin lyase